MAVLVCVLCALGWVLARVRGRGDGDGGWTTIRFGTPSALRGRGRTSLHGGVARV